MRKSGILMPVFSLPGDYGIGTFSKEAYAFVDFLKAAGQKLWQILPLGPTGFGDSPYQSFSTFAGNPYLIDLKALVQEGLLSKKECDSLDWGGSDEYIDYGKMYESKFKALRLAFSRVDLMKEEAFHKFVAEQEAWIKDYALFMAIKNANDGACWTEWEEDVRLRKDEALDVCRKAYMKDILFYEYIQYVFWKQWQALKTYANALDIEIVGDVPIYVAFDSADVWANPELFQLDEKNVPLAVAGCPPDAFSETGQLWGNPLYCWDYHKETNYKWWANRLAHCFRLYDVVRVDHFRAFEAYYSIPYGAKTAVDGEWRKGPGMDFFRAIEASLGQCKIIAEDLGLLTPAVYELLKESSYPGMKVLQFAFHEDSDSDYLPHNHTKNSVIYTGTHDNQTTVGWYKKLPKKDKAFLNEYMSITSPKEVCDVLIRCAMKSVCDTCVIPMQDYLELDDKARINEPGSTGDNWKWRMKKDATASYKTLASRIYKMTKLYSR